MTNLLPHSSVKTSTYEVQALFKKLNDFVLITFKVKALDSSFKHFYTDNKFKEDYKNWGLWEFDVFECFLTRSNDLNHYLELQVSPLNQRFALMIKEPRKSFDYPSSINFSSRVDIVDKYNWQGELKVALKDIPGTRENIYGNFCAILGEDRKCYAKNINQDSRPDFHRPDLFVRL